MAKVSKGTEKWKSIPVSPDYMVSTLGRVKNKHTGRILKQNIQKTKLGKPACFRVGLNINHRTIHYRVHRLMIVFLGKPPSVFHLTIDHINRNPLDNKVGNLRWATQQEQCRNSSNYHQQRIKISKEDLNNMFQRTKLETLKQISKDYGLHYFELGVLLKYMHPKY